jgi:D-alanyl-D-alanine dipeptidase
MVTLVEVRKISPSILLDLRYATADNFVGKILYPGPFCFLQKNTALRLDRVQKKVKKKGLRLKVFDGYRPLSVTKILWEALPDPRYCADPLVGSKHNRGAAVDLTLVDSEGRELAMPSGFDEMGEKVHCCFMGGSDEALRHRQLLQDAMINEGFNLMETEWWHFDDPDWEKYPVLDIPLDSL